MLRCIAVVAAAATVSQLHHWSHMTVLTILTTPLFCSTFPSYTESLFYWLRARQAPCFFLKAFAARSLSCIMMSLRQLLQALLLLVCTLYFASAQEEEAEGEEEVKVCVFVAIELKLLIKSLSQALPQHRLSLAQCHSDHCSGAHPASAISSHQSCHIYHVW
jgi:hypothetical protein